MLMGDKIKENKSQWVNAFDISGQGWQDFNANVQILGQSYL